MRYLSIALLALLFGSLIPAFRAEAQNAKKQELPKPRQLDSGVVWQRDPATGELKVVRKRSPSEPPAADSSPNPSAIRSTTQMVSITCSVTTADGTIVPGLTRGDFRVLDEGAEQKISYFDASTQPASVSIVIDASPSILRDSDEIKDAADALINALAPLDQAAIVDFSAHAYLQLPFTDVRELMRRAVARINVRELFSDTGGSNIYEAVYLAAQDLFAGRMGRKAIVLLTDGQDSGLGLTLDPASTMPSPFAPNRLTFDDESRQLASQDIQVFAVSTENRPKIMTAAWLTSHAGQTLITPDLRRQGIPAYTLFLAELVRHAGGQLYFLHEGPTLADSFRQIARKIRAEYTLGYYPSQNAGALRRAGWHGVRVELVDQPGATVSYRAAYYVPGGS